MKRSFKQKILLTALGRFVLVLTNILLATIIVSVIMELSELLMTSRNDTREMVEMCNGIAIILYGYGVALELRGPFMKHINLYPACITPLRAWIDDLCHKYGIFFILLGLLQEILVHLIMIPNRVLNTAGKELHIFTVCVLIQVFVSVLLVRLSYRLTRAVRLAAREGITIGNGEACGNAE
jgi:hypothetical protein